MSRVDTKSAGVHRTSMVKAAGSLLVLAIILSVSLAADRVAAATPSRSVSTGDSSTAFTRRFAHDPSPVRVARGSRVVLWGDSLAFESKERFADWIGLSTGGELDIETHTFGGTATCDWLADIEQSARTPIAAAVLEFSGNALTKCMTDPSGQSLHGDAYLAAYRAATLRAITILRRAGARVYLVGAPMTPRTTLVSDGALLRGEYQLLAVSLDNVEFIDAGASVLSSSGEWTKTLPCLLEEGPAQGCIDGRIVVRAPDGGHFCPGAGPAVRGVTGFCPRWSSGAARFGRAMATPVMRDIRLRAS